MDCRNGARRRGNALGSSVATRYVHATIRFSVSSCHVPVVATQDQHQLPICRLTGTKIRTLSAPTRAAAVDIDTDPAGDA
jgi:hypothetical protein